MTIHELEMMAHMMNASGGNMYGPSLVDAHSPRHGHKRAAYSEGFISVPDPKIQRNETCPKCESGLKYKKCCGLTSK